MVADLFPLSMSAQSVKAPLSIRVNAMVAGTAIWARAACILRHAIPVNMNWSVGNITL